MLVQPAGGYRHIIAFVESSQVLVKVNAYQKHLGETDVIGDLQGQVGHRACIKEATLQIFAEPEQLLSPAWEGVVTDKFLVLSPQNVDETRFRGFVQKVQLAVRPDRQGPNVLFPKSNAVTAM
ncbi:hypothetical protein D9M71_609630 [compost metagenome]